MASLRDFPARIPESAWAQLTDLQKQCVEMLCDDRMTQAEIGEALNPPRGKSAVCRILSRAFRTIKGVQRQGYTGSLSDKQVAVALA